MRRSRLKILPTKCVSTLGFILLMLACPTIAEVAIRPTDINESDQSATHSLSRIPDDPPDGLDVCQIKDKTFIDAPRSFYNAENLANDGDVIKLKNVRNEASAINSEAESIETRDRVKACDDMIERRSDFRGTGKQRFYSDARIRTDEKTRRDSSSKLSRLGERRYGNPLQDQGESARKVQEQRRNTLSRLADSIRSEKRGELHRRVHAASMLSESRRTTRVTSEEANNKNEISRIGENAGAARRESSRVIKASNRRLDGALRMDRKIQEISPRLSVSNTKASTDRVNNEGDLSRSREFERTVGNRRLSSNIKHSKIDERGSMDRRKASASRILEVRSKFERQGNQEYTRMSNDAGSDQNEKNRNASDMKLRNTRLVDSKIRDVRTLEGSDKEISRTKRDITRFGDNESRRRDVRPLDRIFLQDNNLSRRQIVSSDAVLAQRNKKLATRRSADGRRSTAERSSSADRVTETSRRNVRSLERRSIQDGNRRLADSPDSLLTRKNINLPTSRSTDERRSTVERSSAVDRITDSRRRDIRSMERQAIQDGNLNRRLAETPDSLLTRRNNNLATRRSSDERRSIEDRRSSSERNTESRRRDVSTMENKSIQDKNQRRADSYESLLSRKNTKLIARRSADERRTIQERRSSDERITESRRGDVRPLERRNIQNENLIGRPADSYDSLLNQRNNNIATRLTSNERRRIDERRTSGDMNSQSRRRIVRSLERLTIQDENRGLADSPDSLLTRRNANLVTRRSSENRRTVENMRFTDRITESRRRDTRSLERRNIQDDHLGRRLVDSSVSSLSRRHNNMDNSGLSEGRRSVQERRSSTDRITESRRDTRSLERRNIQDDHLGRRLVDSSISSLSRRNNNMDNSGLSEGRRSVQERRSSTDRITESRRDTRSLERRNIQDDHLGRRLVDSSVSSLSRRHNNLDNRKLSEERRSVQERRSSTDRITESRRRDTRSLERRNIQDDHLGRRLVDSSVSTLSRRHNNLDNRKLSEERRSVQERRSSTGRITESIRRDTRSLEKRNIQDDHLGRRLVDSSVSSLSRRNNNMDNRGLSEGRRSVQERRSSTDRITESRRSDTRSLERRNIQDDHLGRRLVDSSVSSLSRRHNNLDNRKLSEERRSVQERRSSTDRITESRRRDTRSLERRNIQDDHLGRRLVDSSISSLSRRNNNMDNRKLSEERRSVQERRSSTGRITESIRRDTRSLEKRNIQDDHLGRRLVDSSVSTLSRRHNNLDNRKLSEERRDLQERRSSTGRITESRRRDTRSLEKRNIQDDHLGRRLVDSSISSLSRRNNNMDNRGLSEGRRSVQERRSSTDRITESRRDTRSLEKRNIQDDHLGRRLVDSSISSLSRRNNNMDNRGLSEGRRSVQERRSSTDRITESRRDTRSLERRNIQDDHLGRRLVDSSVSSLSRRHNNLDNRKLSEERRSVQERRSSTGRITESIRRDTRSLEKRNIQDDHLGRRLVDSSVSTLSRRHNNLDNRKLSEERRDLQERRSSTGRITESRRRDTRSLEKRNIQDDHLGRRLVDSSISSLSRRNNNMDNRGLSEGRRSVQERRSSTDRITESRRDTRSLEKRNIQDDHLGRRLVDSSISSLSRRNNNMDNRGLSEGRRSVQERRSSTDRITESRRDTRSLERRNIQDDHLGRRLVDSSVSSLSRRHNNLDNRKLSEERRSVQERRSSTDRITESRRRDTRSLERRNIQDDHLGRRLVDSSVSTLSRRHNNLDNRKLSEERRSVQERRSSTDRITESRRRDTRSLERRNIQDDHLGRRLVDSSVSSLSRRNNNLDNRGLSEERRSVQERRSPADRISESVRRKGRSLERRNVQDGNQNRKLSDSSDSFLTRRNKNLATRRSSNENRTVKERRSSDDRMTESSRRNVRSLEWRSIQDENHRVAVSSDSFRNQRSSNLDSRRSSNERRSLEEGRTSGDSITESRRKEVRSLDRRSIQDENLSRRLANTPDSLLSRRNIIQATRRSSDYRRSVEEMRSSIDRNTESRRRDVRPLERRSVLDVNLSQRMADSRNNNLATRRSSDERRSIEDRRSSADRTSELRRDVRSLESRSIQNSNRRLVDSPDSLSKRRNINRATRQTTDERRAVEYTRSVDTISVSRRRNFRILERRSIQDDNLDDRRSLGEVFTESRRRNVRSLERRSILDDKLNRRVADASESLQIRRNTNLATRRSSDKRWSVEDRHSSADRIAESRRRNVRSLEIRSIQDENRRLPDSSDSLLSIRNTNLATRRSNNERRSLEERLSSGDRYSDSRRRNERSLERRIIQDENRRLSYLSDSLQTRRNTNLATRRTSDKRRTVEERRSAVRITESRARDVRSLERRCVKDDNQNRRLADSTDSLLSRRNHLATRRSSEERRKVEGRLSSGDRITESRRRNVRYLVRRSIKDDNLSRRLADSSDSLLARRNNDIVTRRSNDERKNVEERRSSDDMISQSRRMNVHSLEGLKIQDDNLSRRLAERKVDIRRSSDKAFSESRRRVSLSAGRRNIDNDKAIMWETNTPKPLFLRRNIYRVSSQRDINAVGTFAEKLHGVMSAIEEPSELGISLNVSHLEKSAVRSLISIGSNSTVTNAEYYNTNHKCIQDYDERENNLIEKPLLLVLSGVIKNSMESSEPLLHQEELSFNSLQDSLPKVTTKKVSIDILSDIENIHHTDIPMNVEEKHTNTNELDVNEGDLGNTEMENPVKLIENLLLTKVSREENILSMTLGGSLAAIMISKSIK